MKTNRKFLPVLLVLLVLLFLFGRTSIDGTSSAVPSAQPTEDLILVQDLSPAAEEPGQTAPSSEAPEDEDGAEKETLPENGSYTSKEEVMQYLLLYGHLPKNYITKAEAEKAGWNGGSLERILPGMCIGGDRFGNREGLLPKAKGRTWYECDIDTLGKKSRGAKRLIWSNDGLIYYTNDHYDSFTLLYSP